LPLIFGMAGDEFFEVAGGGLPDAVADEGRPAEEGAGGAEGQVGPAPEVEAIAVAEDQAVFKFEFGFQDVVNVAVGLVIGGNVLEGDGQVAAAFTEHVPHGAGAFAVQGW